MIRPSLPDPSNNLKDYIASENNSQEKLVEAQAYLLVALWNSLVVTRGWPTTLLIDDLNSFIPSRSSSIHIIKAISDLSTPLGIYLLDTHASSTSAIEMSKITSKFLKVDPFTSSLLGIAYSHAQSIGNRVSPNYNQVFLNPYSVLRITNAKAIYASPVEVPISHIMSNPSVETLSHVCRLLSFAEQTANFWVQDIFSILKTVLPSKLLLGEIDLSYEIRVNFVRPSRDVGNLSVNVQTKYTLFSSSPTDRIWSILGEHLHPFETEMFTRRGIQIENSPLDRVFSFLLGGKSERGEALGTSVIIKGGLFSSDALNFRQEKTVILYSNPVVRTIELDPAYSFFPFSNSSEDDGVPTIFWNEFMGYY